MVQDGPKGKPKVLVKIPQSVIKNAVGIAVFTTMRTGMWVSGAGGSGVLIGRKPDGTWSPPSGILIHTLGVGFLAGIDIYDCVLVINTYEALSKFSKLRVSLGAEVSVVAGPLGAGGVLETDFKDKKPIFSYMKSRGLYGGVQADGTLLLERNDENARFYGERIPVGDILLGKVKRIPPETRMLLETVRDAEGSANVDHGLLQHVYEQPPPSDVPVGSPSVKPTEEEKINYGSTLLAHDQQGFAPPPMEGYYAPQTGAMGQQQYPPHPQQFPPPPHQAVEQHLQGFPPQQHQFPPPPQQGGLQYPPDYPAQQQYGAPPPPAPQGAGEQHVHYAPQPPAQQAPQFPPPPHEDQNPPYWEKKV